MNQSVQTGDQVRPLVRIRFATLYNQDADFLTIIRIRYRKCQCITNTNFRLMFRQVLKILRPDVTTIDNNEILFAPGNYQTAINTVTDIAGVQPAIAGKRVRVSERIISAPTPATRQLLRSYFDASPGLNLRVHSS